MTRPRGDREQQPPKTVIILGAGASAADGAPTQSDLLRGFFDTYRRRLRGTSPPNRLIHQDLANYFQAMWGIDVFAGNLRKAQFPTFEESLGILEIAHSRGEFFRGLGGGDQHITGAQRLRTSLVTSIALLLKRELRTAGGHHIALLKGLHGQIRDTTFISLNYDILVDNAIMRCTDGVPDYGVRFRGAAHGHPRSCCLLLKPHGSLNWLYCPTCNALTLTPREKAAARLHTDRHLAACGVCQGPRVPIIIPPTFFKVMSNFYLQQIWKRAEDELLRADRIILCGYSFPDADIHIKYLLKRAEINRSGLPPAVYIVNEHVGKKGLERKAERNRYERFFRQKNQVHWTRLSFEQFAENPTLIEDPSQWL